MKSVDFSRVKATVSTLSFFTNIMRQEPSATSGATIRFNTCPNPACGTSIRANSYRVSIGERGWNCFSCGEKGDVIQAASLYWGVSIQDAAVKLLDGSHEYVEPKISTPKTMERDNQAIMDVIMKMKAATPHNDDLIVSYLKSRGIDKSIYDKAVKKGLIVALPTNPVEATRWLTKYVGKDLLVSAGMWKKGSKAPAIAYRPLAFVSTNNQSIEFRLIGQAAEGDVKAIRYGSSAPWIWEGTKNVLITEGAIDLLSAVALGSQRTIIGLPGCENYSMEWFKPYQQERFLLALDSDVPGVKAVYGYLGKDGLLKIGLKQKLVDLGIDVSVHKLPEGCKDLNEQLVS